MAAKKGDMVQATREFVGRMPNGRQERVKAGELLASTHEIVEAFPGFFGPPKLRRSTEQTTAAPGEQRQTVTKSPASDDAKQQEE